MGKGNNVFRQVMKGVNSTSGSSSKDKADQAKRSERGRDQAAFDRSRRATQDRALSRKEEREREERWANREQGK